MYLLSTATALMELVTSAVADIEVSVSYVDLLAGVITPVGDNRASITTATTTTIVGSPAASTQRNIKQLNIRNNHASTTCDCTVQTTDGGDAATLAKFTLLAGEWATLDDRGAWTHYDANGGKYLTVGPVASQAEMEAGTSLAVFVTPGRQHFHPSAAKFWCLFTGNSTTVLASYNLTSITDGTTEATVTIATDFSSANWSPYALATGTASTVAAARLPCARSIAAGTLIVFCVDGAATTALQDPTQWSVGGFGDQ